LSGIVHLAVWRVAVDRQEDPEGSGWPAEVVDALGLPRAKLQQMPPPAELAADLELMIA
jgi:hypothetical protein